MWGPQTIAKLVHIIPITMVYGTYNELVTGAYKPTNITGGGHIVGNDLDWWKNNTVYTVHMFFLLGARWFLCVLIILLGVSL